MSHMKRNSVPAFAKAIKVKPFDCSNTLHRSIFTNIIKVRMVTYYQMSLYLNNQRRDYLSYWAFQLICFSECGMCDVLCYSFEQFKEKQTKKPGPYVGKWVFSLLGGALRILSQGNNWVNFQLSIRGKWFLGKRMGIRVRKIWIQILILWFTEWMTLRKWISQVMLRLYV